MDYTPATSAAGTASGFSFTHVRRRPSRRSDAARLAAVHAASAPRGPRSQRAIMALDHSWAKQRAGVLAIVPGAAGAMSAARAREMGGADSPVHIPVLLPQVLEHSPRGPAGATSTRPSTAAAMPRAVLDACAPDGRVLGIDRDPDDPHRARRRAAPRRSTAAACILATGSFAALARRRSPRDGSRPVDGVLFDLGLSSFHLDASGRGFSFTRDEPLDMRFDPTDDTSRERRRHPRRTRRRRAHRDLSRLRRGALRLAHRPHDRRPAAHRAAHHHRPSCSPRSSNRCPPAVRWRAEPRRRAHLPGAAHRRQRRARQPSPPALPQAVAALAPRRPPGRHRLSLARRPHGEALPPRPGSAPAACASSPSKPMHAGEAEIAANPRAAQRQAALRRERILTSGRASIHATQWRDARWTSKRFATRSPTAF